MVRGTLHGPSPEWAHTFLSGIIRWSTRVGAYLFLLTDAYPPFSFDDVDYPVRPVLPERGALNRVAVLFRIILAIPAFFFDQIVQNGLTFPLLLVMWFVVLITGEMPQSLYPTYMSLLRYQVRFNAWLSMITPEYAWGMLGDTVLVDTGYTPPPFVPPAGAAPAPTDVPGAPTPQPPPQPLAYPSAPGAQAPTAPPAGAPGSPPVWPPPQPAPTFSPGCHAAPVAVGAHVRLSGGATTADCARPARGGAGLDDLRHRLGLDRVGGADHPELRTSQAQHGNRAPRRGAR